VVSGGPGTGKTSTVVRLLAIVLGQVLSEGRRRPRALLLAPTGKAAARLMEAVERTRTALDADADVRDLIPSKASTIHRALHAANFARDNSLAAAALAADVVIVDEASMIDLELMRSLVDAVPEDA